MHDNIHMCEGLAWTVELVRPKKPAITMPVDPSSGDGSYSKTVDDIVLDCTFQSQSNLTGFVITAQTQTGEAECYVSLVGKSTGVETRLHNFDGPVDETEVFRQSPHDPSDHVVDMAKQAVPMVAFESDKRFTVAVGDAPAFYDNFTTQNFRPHEKYGALSSGDSGETPGHSPQRSKVLSHYHHISATHTHRFEGILFESSADSIRELRGDVFRAIAARWGDVTDRLGTVAFGSNYMHVRKNETGNSRYWICPGIEYANKQYTRDAFWQAMVLPAWIEQECYTNEAIARTPGAERPLFTLIWSYRITTKGGTANLDAARHSLSYIESHVRDGMFYSHTDPEKKDFQSWYDLCAFDLDDVVTYNQGLLAVALLAARAMGIETMVSADTAAAGYRSLFDKRGFYPLSRKKDMVALDALVGDLLSQLLFDQPLLDRETVHHTFETARRTARTEHGYRVTSDFAGGLVERERYSTDDYRSRQCDAEQGAYANGGSYYLYNMLFLIDCYLHGVPEAEEEIIWRTRIEFERGGTYHEYLDTITGKPGKANQGWNGAIYAIWNELIKQGKATDRFLVEIDSLES